MAKQQKAKKFEYSTPAFEGKVTLHTEQAKNLACRVPSTDRRTLFSSAMTALYTIDVVSRKLSKRRGFNHTEIIEALDKQLTLLDEDLIKHTKQLETFAAAENITQRAAYSRPEEVAYRITTPQISRLGSILQRFDQLIILIDTLWLSGKISPDEVEQFKKTKSRAMVKAFRSIISTGFAARDKMFASTDDADKEAQDEILKAEAESVSEDAEEVDLSDAESESATA